MQGHFQELLVSFKENQLLVQITKGFWYFTLDFHQEVVTNREDFVEDTTIVKFNPLE